MTNLPSPQTSFAKAASIRAISSESPYWIGNLIHLYLEIEIKLDLEGAESVTNARRAHEYVRKAADASFLTAEQFGGQVLEIHGRTLHIGIPYETLDVVENLTLGASGLLHVLLKRAYGSGGPDGWTMAADHDATLTITSVGIHDDTSLVSLSPAANFPAKKLGNDEIPLNQIGARIHGRWSCEDLDSIAIRFNSSSLAQKNSRGIDLFADVMLKQAQAVQLESLSSVRDIYLQAAPVGEPSGEDLFSCFGYVLSMDLDGFTKKVAAVANGTPEQQQKLAKDFFEIMEKSSEFAERHPEWFIQFPFAGDNAIFAVTAKGHREFEVLKKIIPISIAVDWEDQMGHLARHSGFGGWGQAAAGGDQIRHGNSKGNLHVSGIELGNRRFLVGIGPGMRYARQAFSHTDPSPKEIAMYRPNISELHSALGEKFYECPGPVSQISSYFKKARIDDLKDEMRTVAAERNQKVSAAANTSILLSGTQTVHRPHAWLD